MIDRFSTLSMIVEPILGGLGAEFSEPTVGRPKRRKSKPGHREFRGQDFPPEKRDAALLRALGRAGIQVRTVQTTGKKSSSG